MSAETTTTTTDTTETPPPAPYRAPSLHLVDMCQRYGPHIDTKRHAARLADIVVERLDDGWLRVLDHGEPLGQTISPSAAVARIAERLGETVESLDQAAARQWREQHQRDAEAARTKASATPAPAAQAPEMRGTGAAEARSPAATVTPRDIDETTPPESLG